MDLGLKGKNAAITGSSQGIGNAIATALAAEGCNVALSGARRGAPRWRGEGGRGAGRQGGRRGLRPLQRGGCKMLHRTARWTPWAGSTSWSTMSAA